MGLDKGRRSSDKRSSRRGRSRSSKHSHSSSYKRSSSRSDKSSTSSDRRDSRSQRSSSDSQQTEKGINESIADVLLPVGALVVPATGSSPGRIQGRRAGVKQTIMFTVAPRLTCQKCRGGGEDMGLPEGGPCAL